MAPYRNRSGRRDTQIDHDVYEGLPIQQWGRSRRTLDTNAKPDIFKLVSGNNAWPELPMPKESGMLPTHSRDLLRLARMGHISKPSPPPATPPMISDEKDSDNKSTGQNDTETPDIPIGAKQLTIRGWAPLPKEKAKSVRDFLARKRKGIIVGTAAMRKAKVRRLDSQGNMSIAEVFATEGQKIEGEILEEVPLTQPPAPGSVVEGMGIVNSNGIVVPHESVPKKRPHPPRRRAKGPGRGRRKKVEFAVHNRQAYGKSTVTKTSRVKGTITRKLENDDITLIHRNNGDTVSRASSQTRGDDDESLSIDAEGDDDRDDYEITSELAHRDFESPKDSSPKELTQQNIEQQPSPDAKPIVSHAPLAVPSREMSSSPDIPTSDQVTSTSLSRFNTTTSTVGRKTSVNLESPIDVKTVSVTVEDCVANNEQQQLGNGDTVKSEEWQVEAQGKELGGSTTDSDDDNSLLDDLQRHLAQKSMGLI